MTLLASDRAGQGEPPLLLHGIGSTRDDLAALLPRLAEDFDVLSPEPARPRGVTDRDDVAADRRSARRCRGGDLDARGLERVHVLGNSLGARIGIELAARRRTLSVVAISPPAWGFPPSASTRDCS
jgi:pimeloyl-ACP methyl ester carboxylesterase